MRMICLANLAIRRFSGIGFGCTVKKRFIAEDRKSLETPNVPGHPFSPLLPEHHPVRFKAQFEDVRGARRLPESASPGKTDFGLLQLDAGCPDGFLERAARLLELPIHLLFVQGFGGDDELVPARSVELRRAVELGTEDGGEAHKQFVALHVPEHIVARFEIVDAQHSQGDAPVVDILRVRPECADVAESRERIKLRFAFQQLAAAGHLYDEREPDTGRNRHDQEEYYANSA